jgi:hypothetical protein
MYLLLAHFQYGHYSADKGVFLYEKERNQWKRLPCIWGSDLPTKLSAEYLANNYNCEGVTELRSRHQARTMQTTPEFIRQRFTL